MDFQQISLQPVLQECFAEMSFSKLNFFFYNSLSQSGENKHAKVVLIKGYIILFRVFISYSRCRIKNIHHCIIFFNFSAKMKQALTNQR